MTIIFKNPLQWPPNWQRFGAPGRAPRLLENFSTTPEACIDSLEREIKRYGVDSAIITMDMHVGRLGRPLTGDVPVDPGVAVYFSLDESERVLACDRFTAAQFNARALALTFESFRRMDRYGTGQVVEMAMVGLKALPAKRGWWDVLNVSQGATVEEIESAYRTAALLCHPDRPGGSESAMAIVNTARDDGLRARGAA